jgi:hypothetical protein
MRVRRLFTARRDAVSGIYGTIVATSIVAGLSESHDLSPAQAMEIVVVSQAVLWLGHAYAQWLSQKVESNDSGARRLILTALYEWPVLRAAVPAAFAIALWWFGLVSEARAYWLAIGLGIGELAMLGFRFGRRLGQSAARAAGTAAVDAAFGALIVLAKVIFG